MVNILPEIIEILQALKEQKQNLIYVKPQICIHCGMVIIWGHGHYDRKPDRYNNASESLNPVSIPRFFCPHCKKTFSLLPKYLSPRRWYAWSIQQAVILRILFGGSMRKTSRATSVSRSTCLRWWARLKERYPLHSSALRSCYSDLGRHEDFIDFWKSCLQKISFAKAMKLCNQTGAIIP